MATILTDDDGLSLIHGQRLVVSACDRAHEATLDLDAPLLHWSIPDPVGHNNVAFEEAFRTLSERIDRLARAAEAA